MLIERCDSQVSIRTPAKVNLYLDVLGKRDDGYHEVETLLCPISLYDQLNVQVVDEDRIGLQLVLPQRSSFAAVSEDDAWRIPADGSNLVCKAAEMVLQELGQQAGLQIRLIKGIPSAAGLGGGSSDAAAAVVATMLAVGSWDRDLAITICKRLGSDVPFFLGDARGHRAAYATGRGENCLFLSAKPTLTLALTHPPAGCSTAEIYKAFRNSGRSSVLSRPSSIQEIIQACETGQRQQIGFQLFNALQFAATQINSWIGLQLKILSNCGAESAIMSGSGSSCFAIRTASMQMQQVEQHALQAGISRVYDVSTCYEPSIECQLALDRTDDGE